MEDISLDVLDVNCSDEFSIHLYKHSISLRSSNLFRYGLCYYNAKQVHVNKSPKEED